MTDCGDCRAFPKRWRVYITNRGVAVREGPAAGPKVRWSLRWES